MLDARFKILVIISLLILTTSFAYQKRALSKETTVFVFLSETCPICQNYTLTLKQLYSKYKDHHICIVGVFPNHYSNQKSIDEFKKTYSIPFDLVMDKKGELTKHFKATITPEVFVESADKKLLYSGRIDDSFYALGKRRTVISSTELADALEQITSGKPINTSKTQAVGCIISASK